jgi:hypothetical protein
MEKKFLSLKSTTTNLKQSRNQEGAILNPTTLAFATSKRLRKTKGRQWRFQRRRPRIEERTLQTYNGNRRLRVLDGVINAVAVVSAGLSWKRHPYNLWRFYSVFFVNDFKFWPILSLCNILQYKTKFQKGIGISLNAMLYQLSLRELFSTSTTYQRKLQIAFAKFRLT